MEHRIYHLLSHLDGTVLDILIQQVGVAPEKAQWLTEIGGVYLGQEGDRIDAIERTHAKAAVAKGQYMRVHMSPKRFPVSAIDWDKTVLFENEDFILVNKPRGIPVHPTVDNQVENVVTQISNNKRIPLFVTQRLDVPTGGLFILAKTKKFQSQFNESLKKSNVQKKYRAWTEFPIECAQYTHHMEVSPYGPKVLHNEARERTQICELIIQKCEYDIEIGAYCHEIQLLTGRTHQIRAQLSFMGCPLLGDQLYGSQRPSPFAAEGETIALESYELSFRHLQNTHHFRLDKHGQLSLV